MDALQIPYRELLEKLGDSNVSGTLSGWLAGNQDECAWLRRLSARGIDSIPEVPIEELWRLYALSRVSDRLIHDIVSGSLRSEEYAAFMLGLGLQPIPELPFQPFYHEIFSVTPSPDDDSGISLLGSEWPGFMCGSLLCARAGVSVSAGSEHLRKPVAESSTLYWAYLRKNRPTEDLSAGWGGNSQWRTSFRRDYAFPDRFEYNVDAEKYGGDGELSAAQKIELVRNRCFVVSEDSHVDLCPYDLRHTEKRA